MNIFSFFRSPQGFGTAGFRKHSICGAVTVLGFTGQYGVATTETGISVKTFSVRYYPEINEKIMDNVGETRGKVKSQKFSRDIKFSGEVLNATGVMAFGLLTACVPSNTINDFGDNSGTPLLDEVNVTQERAGWKMADFSLSSYPGLTL